MCIPQKYMIPCMYEKTLQKYFLKKKVEQCCAALCNLSCENDTLRCVRTVSKKILLYVCVCLSPPVSLSPCVCVSLAMCVCLSRHVCVSLDTSAYHFPTTHRVVCCDSCH